MSSVSRALGIPCRVVTNYSSAHDTNSNLVIEHYINEKGETDSSTRDMIWYEEQLLLKYLIAHAEHDLSIKIYGL